MGPALHGHHRRFVSRSRLALTFGAAACLLGAACASRHGPEAPIRFLFTGDIILHRQVAVEMATTGESPWAGMGDLLRRADWVGGNLEGAIGEPHDCRTTDSAACFVFPKSTPGILARAGFDALTLANNHAADLGDSGQARTRDQLREVGLLGVGFAESPRFVRVRGVTLAIVAINLIPDAGERVQRIPSTEVAQKLRLARGLADLVVVSIHWGRELHEWAGDDQRSDAEWLIEQGADLIVGHHPHVVQPPECLHSHPVFFSLGNHVFDQRDPVTKTGLIADCTVEGGAVRCGGVETKTRRGSAVPVVSDSTAVPELQNCAVPLRRPVEVSGYELRPEAWRPDAPDSGIVLEGWKDGRRVWSSRRVEIVALQGGVDGSEPDPYIMALKLHHSDLDKELALRPHIYAADDHGLIAKWRGTALAWPLLDAVVDDHGELCALHRGDSFIRPDPTVTTTRTLHYRWNGFGFSATNDSSKNADCQATMAALVGGGRP